MLVPDISTRGAQIRVTASGDSGQRSETIRRAQPQRARPGAPRRGSAVALRARRAHRADPQRHPAARRRPRRRRTGRRGARGSPRACPDGRRRSCGSSPDGRVVLALEIAVDSLAVAVVGLGGHVIELVRVERPAATSLDDIVADLAELADGAAATWRTDALVGIGSRSSVSSAATTGSCRRRRTSGGATSRWARLWLGALRTPAPVVVANEADLGALAEHRRGAAAGTDDVSSCPARSASAAGSSPAAGR